MKNKASLIVKHIVSVFSSIARAKLLGLRSKVEAVRARVVLFSLLKSRRLSLGAITQKIHAFLDKTGMDNEDRVVNVEGEHNEGAIVLYKNNARQPTTGTDSEDTMAVVDNGYINACDDDYDEDEDKHPDLRHSLFDEELGDGQGSVIDMVKNSKENGGEDFSLEDEIDHVADLFIRRFWKQIRLQKLESFNRYQEMLDGSV